MASLFFKIFASWYIQIGFIHTMIIKKVKSIFILFFIVAYVLIGYDSNTSIENDGNKTNEILESKGKMTEQEKEQGTVQEKEPKEDSLWKVLNKDSDFREHFITGVSLGWIGVGGTRHTYEFLIPPT